VRILIFILHAAVASAAFNSISGSVTDPTNSAVPGASVDVLVTGKGIVARTKTDSHGRFHTDPLAEGTYEIVVARPTC
jgi:citrate lyase alpha subunit